MPRPPRVHDPGSYRHITARGNAGAALFRDDHDRRRFLSGLRDVTRKHDWLCLAFCLMTTHYHLLVQEHDVPLARSMHLLHSRYVRAFCQRHGHEGHVFGERYHVATLDDDSHLLSAIRYVALNPVEAGLCPSPAEWAWSSYAAVVGAGRPWSFVSADHLLGLFGENRAKAVDVLRRFVELPRS